MIPSLVNARGRKHGAYVEYYHGGTVRIRAKYVRGRLDGPFTKYYETGKPWIVANYRKRKLDGKYTEKNTDGVTIEVATYRAGTLHGPREITRPKIAVSQQIWFDGTLHKLLVIGPHTPASFRNPEKLISPYPRSVAKLQETLLG